ncbi:MFS transporter [Sphingomonas sp. MMS24-J13]|uniref:MFS transporter n=1 Tax=Sphingomonas sp. MMS24-J13 TaxID=3238686 RepID=UPI00384B3490
MTARNEESAAAEVSAVFDMPVIAICSLAYLLDGVVFSIMGPLAPEIAHTLALTNAALGPIFSANLAGQCFGLILFPLLANRTGHRIVVVGTLAGFGLFQAISGAAETASQLLLLRFVTGFFLGGSLPSCMAMVTGAAPPHRRGLAVTVLFTGYAIGSTAAGLLSGLFLAHGGWRAAMIAVGGLCILSAAIAWVWLREPTASADADAAASPGVIGDALSLLSPPYLVGTLALWVLFIAMLTLSYCLNSWLPIMLVQLGRDTAYAAMAVSVFSLGGIVAALGVGLLIDRFGATRVLVVFLCAASLLLVVIGQVLASASPPVLLALLIVCGFFALGAYGGVNVVLAGFYPSATRAFGIGVTKSVGRVGTVVAPILVGVALSAGMHAETVMSLFAIPAALAAAALLVIAAANRGRYDPDSRAKPEARES